ncbi:glycerophosphodiester phosphodiesterase family protein [Virgibacillus sp. Bac330]|uniref:glycerophosphodiester phosphodiesterase n=1 Tax=Virgibacillus sp. Bac330 TaxID=2419841 RepID=UPI000EF52821|nr:glycerophosphodiester phosphodiesterase family protein [Virgibacillus sp. Bac330]
MFILLLLTSLSLYAHAEIQITPMVTEKAEIYAHRGANDRFNESTVTAYEIAARDGVDALELDLRMTEDGELVVMHDDTIDRTTNGSGKVSAYTFAELREFETVEVFQQEEKRETIPTLEEVLQVFEKKEHYYIETRLVHGKAKMETKLIELLKEYDLLDRQHVSFQSFSESSLEQLQLLAPSIPLTLLFKKGAFNLEKAKEVPYSAIGVESTDVSLQVVNELHKQGKEVHVYFTDLATQKQEQKRVKSFNVDGYFTDFINYTQQLLDDKTIK